MKLDKYGFIDRTGKLVIPAIYDMIGGFNEGLAKVRINGKHGFINPKDKNEYLEKSKMLIIQFLNESN